MIAAGVTERAVPVLATEGNESFRLRCEGLLAEKDGNSLLSRDGFIREICRKRLLLVVDEENEFTFWLNRRTAAARNVGAYLIAIVINEQLMFLFGVF